MRKQQQARKKLQAARYAACRANETAYAARRLDDAHHNHRYWEGWWRWTVKQVNAAQQAREIVDGADAVYAEANQLELDGLAALEEFKAGRKPVCVGRPLPASAWSV